MAVEKSQLTAKIEKFTVNRLTYGQFIEASCNTLFDEGTGEIISAVNDAEASLKAGEFYMTVDETINPDFQLSAYVTLVDFYQQTSSMLNFRGVTYDEVWAAKLSAYETLSTADSPSDLYIHYIDGQPQISNDAALYEYPRHGDIVVYSKTGREFMYTQILASSPSTPANTQFQYGVQAVGYWSEIGNDWMLSVIQNTTATAVRDISGYIDYLSAYASEYLSGEISSVGHRLEQVSVYLSAQVKAHLDNTGNPHRVTAAQTGAYLSSQTSSAVQLQNAFEAVSGVIGDLEEIINGI